MPISPKSWLMHFQSLAAPPAGKAAIPTPVPPRAAEPAPAPPKPVPVDRPLPTTNIHNVGRAARARNESPHPAILEYLRGLVAAGEARGAPTASGYYIPDFVTYGKPLSGELPRGQDAVRVATPARIQPETTLDAQLAAIYGDDWQAIRDSIVSPTTRNPVSMEFKGPAETMEQNLGQPLFNITTAPPGEAIPFGKSWQGPFTTVVSLTESQKLGVPPEVLRQHELGHTVGAPVFISPGNKGGGDFVFASPERRSLASDVRQQLVQQYPALQIQPGKQKSPILDQLVRRTMRSGTTWRELGANLFQMRRMEHGLTGNPMTTNEDRLRAVRRWLSLEPPAAGKPAMKTYQMFPGDPTYQHGPAAGKPAEGWNDLLLRMQQLLPRMSPQSKQRVMDVLGHGADASVPGEAVYA